MSVERPTLRIELVNFTSATITFSLCIVVPLGPVHNLLCYWGGGHFGEVG